MADRDWKTGRLELDPQKYVVLKSCLDCDGSGSAGTMIPGECPTCGGRGVVKPHDRAQYFVLRIDCGPDGAHDPHARSALLHYAECVRGDNPDFADDIMGWLDTTYIIAETMNNVMETTGDGFEIFGRLTDSYGNKVRVQESNLAHCGPHCWLFCVRNGKDASPHLNVDEAKELIGYLWLFVARAIGGHLQEQPRSTPATDDEMEAAIVWSNRHPLVEDTEDAEGGGDEND